MADYEGLKIPAKIVIVARPIVNGKPIDDEEEDPVIPKGYVVPLGDKKQLESAHRWADWTQWNWDKDLHKSVKGDTYLGTEHVYENGKFKMTVKESAAGSWQGGKLSFWTCEIEAPDGKKFNIGINSDYLCETIMHNTLINGKVQGDIWIGKVKGNTMAVTEHQPSFAQAIKDENKRNLKQTAKYNPGDIVKTLTSTDVYIGTWYQLFKVDTKSDYSWGSRKHYCTYTITLYDKPQERHVFRRIHDEDGKLKVRNDIEVKSTKPKRILTGKTLDVSTVYTEMTKDFIERYEADKNGIKRPYDNDWHLWIDDAGSNKIKSMVYSDKADATFNLQELIDLINEQSVKWNYRSTINIQNEDNKIIRTLSYDFSNRD